MYNDTKVDVIFKFIGLQKLNSRSSMNTAIKTYNDSLASSDKEICELLANTFDEELPKAESKIWHGHPVWFLEGNPVVGYAKRKNDLQLLFWSGQSFEEPGLEVEGTFKAAQKRYTSVDQINLEDLKRWLQKSEQIQWDYKNIVKKKGVLDLIK